MKTATANVCQWIESICRRFSDATGWPLLFAPAGEERFGRMPQHCPETLWTRDLSDGENRIGRLWIELPEDARRDRSFQAICALAEIIAGLIDNVLALQCAVDTGQRDVRALADIGLAARDEENPLETLKRILRGVVHLTGFRCAALFVLDASAETLRLRAQFDQEPHPHGLQIPSPQRACGGDGPDAAAFSRGRIRMHPETHPEWSAWLPREVRTAVCSAIHTDDGPVGTLWLFDRRHRTGGHHPKGGRREGHVLESVTAQIGSVLQRVIFEREGVEQDRLREDLKVASAFQERDILGALPADCGFRAAAVNTSRYELGGDLCELIPLDDRRTVIAVGDASGDSIPAAMVKSTVRGALHALALNAPEFVENTVSMVKRLNRTLHALAPVHQFMSLFLGVLDASTGKLTYTNAGHPLPLTVRHASIGSLESHGLLLGVSEEAEYRQSALHLGPGDVLVAFTDGVSEAMNGRRAMFREDGIERALRRSLGLPAEEIFRAIWSDLERHTAGGGDADDRTLLVLKINGA